MKTTRRHFVHLMGATGAAAALGGCESATEALSALLSAEPEADFRPPMATEIDLASHLINRLT
ncbi:MAG: twin-arginine translocation signal domain-containing protein, partial [Planctomycetota bacterium]|nr:twin-arginine translocation signal domain-containing protein [Planctomycetota bacterium]